MTAEQKPILTVIAGPNGAGKSTLSTLALVRRRLASSVWHKELHKVDMMYRVKTFSADMHAAIANLPVALQQADRTLIFDNSTRAGYKKLLTIENGRVTEQARELPEWIRTSLPQEVIGPNQSQSTQ